MIHVTPNCRARLNDLLHLNLHEVVIRIKVLFHQSFDLQESGQQVPFVFGRIDWVCKAFIVVEWFQKRIEWVPGFEIRRC